MTLPTYRSIELPLLQLIYSSPRHEIASRDAYAPLAVHFQLKLADLELTRNDGKGSRWENMVQWARKELNDQGYLDREAPYGVWRLSGSGVAATENARFALNQKGDVAVDDLTDAQVALGRITAPIRSSTSLRLTAEERQAIELRAVTVASDYFRSEFGYEVADVGAVESFDLLATKKGSPELKIEVKGTRSSGSEVVLTKNEVALHRHHYPNTALAIVRGISLSRDGGQPMATGGVLEVRMPWKPDDADLVPLAYQYSTGL